jgi:hypothetical protein
MWLIICFFFIWLFPFACHPQFQYSLESSGIGYANTNGGLKQSFSALDFNPASTLELEPVLFTLGAYTLQKVQLVEGGGLFPFHKRHAAGIKIAQYRLLSYQELLISALYSYEILPQTVLGIRGNYYRVHIPEYGSYQTLFIDVGFLSQFLPDVRIGGFIRNVNQGRIEQKATLPLPILFDLTFAYEPSQQVSLLLGVEKDPHYPLEYKGCIRYQWHSHFQTSLGYQWQKETIDGGIDLLYSPWQFGFHLRYSWLFGPIPQITILYFPSQKNLRQNEG